ncbi:response regulator transcription factor [bacterium]|nr:MAG: response regulator transcription factor [bacterium]
MPSEGEAPKSRQDQILLLAAEGMTDKEIAARLSLSPETVGTYWRRILSKYSAASRTEVVAKVIRLQAEANISEVSEVNECLQEVADHLLLVLSGRQDGTTGSDPLAARLLHDLPVAVVALDAEGSVHFTNRPLDGVNAEAGEPFEYAIEAGERESLREALGQVLDDGHPSVELLLTLGSMGYRTTITPSIKPEEAPLAILTMIPA